MQKSHKEKSSLDNYHTRNNSSSNESQILRWAKVEVGTAPFLKMI